MCIPMASSHHKQDLLICEDQPETDRRFALPVVSAQQNWPAMQHQGGRALASR